MLRLAHHLQFSDLYTRDGLVALDAAFVEKLKANDVALHNKLLAARAAPEGLSAKDESTLLIALAPMVESFVAELFGIQNEHDALLLAHRELAPLYVCKRLFVQRRAAKAMTADAAQALDGNALKATLEGWFGEPLTELSFARHVLEWVETKREDALETATQNALTIASQYAAWALLTPAGKAKHKAGVLFKQPHKTDYAHLVPVESVVVHGVTMQRLPEAHLRARHGFALTDAGFTLTQALDHANYCIFCHNQGKDSCSKGLKDKDGSFKQNELGITLEGCPLEEKISEMHTLKSEALPLAALAVAVVDNPMIAGTGHRICNDCMKACIYQKQEPVNIPLAESQVLSDVLHLPFGFEIYSLLTRWNPLNIRRPLPLPASGKRVLIAGLGPAGYTLAHHLLNDGHEIFAIDGLKIEPLPPEISGVDAQGTRVEFTPIRDIKSVWQSLDKRTPSGFGGVAEYGITVRWDKNYLTVLRLLLERRAEFSMQGGVRFGSNITAEQAFGPLGFDHIALCMGAGKPTLLDIPNGLARGVRTASDFLMGLQSSGAARADSITNLQVRLPILVVGGGLTAIDTSTESLAYYAVQVEKFLTRYEVLVAERGEASVRAAWSEEDAIIAEEFLTHARALRAERARPNANVTGLLQRWGGATMVYRKTLQDAPSYRLNHEEVEKALEEGIVIAPNMTPISVELDRFGHAEALTCRDAEGRSHRLPARTILIAAGTSPNTVLAREESGQALGLTLDGKFFTAVNEAGEPVKPAKSAKLGEAHMLMHVTPDGRAISFFGDMHPSFAGNVVKAMASAKRGYPLISRMLAKQVSVISGRWSAEKMTTSLRASVHAVTRLTPNIVEVVLRAPLAAENFLPGQFYRLQNVEANALHTHGEHATTLAMEGLAMTGAWVDKAAGLVAVIGLEMGGSSDLMAHLRIGENVVLMGPTGTPTETHTNRPGGETVLLVGGGLGNAVLFSIGKALRAAGSRVLYFAGYKKMQDRYKVEEIEAAADCVVWCSDEAPGFAPTRPQDKAFVGNIVAAMVAYADGQLGASPIALSGVDRVIAIGSDRMMAAVAAARHAALKPHLKPGHVAIGSINSPMQCMMKEICAQCLQQHTDPATGEVFYVYSCTNQDQPLDMVSFPHLAERLKQNSVQEKLTAAWIDRSLQQLGKR